MPFGTPSMVNAAIGLEILFESFNATVDGPSGGIGEQCQVVRNLGHNLLQLFDAIPEATRNRLGFQTYRYYFEGRIGNLFVLARYSPERGRVCAARLLEAYLGLTPDDYQDSGRLSALLEACPGLAGLTVYHQAPVLAVLADALPSDSAARVFEAYLVLAEEDPQERARLRSQIAQPALDTTGIRCIRAVFLSLLGESLKSGENFPIELLRSTKPLLVSESADPSATRFDLRKQAYLCAWLRTVHGSHVAAWVVCRSLAAFFRSMMEDLAPTNTYEDRSEVLQEYGGFWRDIQAVAFEHFEYERPLGQSGAAKAERKLHEFHTLAEQFENRLLFERLFRVLPRRVPRRMSAMRGWQPWRLALLPSPDGFGGPNSRQARLGRSIWPDVVKTLVGLFCGRDFATSRTATPEGTVRALQRVLPAAGCLTEQPASELDTTLTDQSTDPELPLRDRRAALHATFSQGDTSPMTDGQSEFARRLLVDTPLQDMIPPGAVWIRALLDYQGRLRWTAWKLNENTLQLLDEGVSSRNAATELEVATVRFDREVERTWVAQQGLTFGDIRDDDALTKLAERVQSCEMRRARARPPFGERSTIDGSNLATALNRVGESAPLLARLGNELLKLATGSDPDSVAEDWLLEDFLAGLAMLRQPWGPALATVLGKEDIAKREQRRREALDAASHRLLDVVQRHFDIRPLWPKLPRGQWATSDVLFQVPGPLLAAPLAWLEFGIDEAGRPTRLYQTVASTGSVISLTLRYAAEREAKPPPHRVLSTHWEAPERRNASRGMYRLQEDLVNTGREHAWEVWCLGDRPEASAVNLCAALSDTQRPFGVLVVNAHGIQGRHGIKLAGGDLLCTTDVTEK